MLQKKTTMPSFDKVIADLLAGLIELENATGRLETLPDPVIQVLVTGEEMWRYTCFVMNMKSPGRGLFDLAVRMDGEKAGGFPYELKNMNFDIIMKTGLIDIR